MKKFYLQLLVYKTKIIGKPEMLREKFLCVEAYDPSDARRGAINCCLVRGFYVWEVFLLDSTKNKEI